MHKSSAGPFALLYLALIVYASLYPFSAWRDQDIAPWAFWFAPWPQYWTRFDVVANVLGYMPLGYWLALMLLRRLAVAAAVGAAVLGGAVLSLGMETAQVYLPSRVPSNLDFVLNVLGTALGAAVACEFQRRGVFQRWRRFFDGWLIAGSRGAVVLLALWPLALLYPTPQPLGLGQVLERLEAALAALLQGSAFEDWLPLREMELQPPLPTTQSLIVALGLFIPGLLAYSVVPQRRHRTLVMVGLLGLALTVPTLTSALSLGPENAAAWLNVRVRWGVGWAVFALLVALPLSCTACVGVLLLALGVQVTLVNLTPVNVYFEQALFRWEQGRFIRFYGLAQWLGWLWPYAVLGHALRRLWPQQAGA
ncbi:MAG: VanZ family protein [Rhodoferax sp.]